MRGRRVSRRGRRELLVSPTTQYFGVKHMSSPRMPYPHEASGTPRKHPVALQHLPLPPRVRPTARVGVGSAGCGGGAFDVIVKALDDVARTRLFEVGGFVAEDLVFEGGLGKGRGGQKMCNVGRVLDG